VVALKERSGAFVKIGCRTGAGMSA